MTEAHIYAFWFLAVWVVLANERRFVEGEGSLNGLDKTELKMLHVVFRHGDRTPDREEMELYPEDPNINETFYPFGHKALTQAGKAREYQIGVFLRKQYKEFLNPVYVADEVHMQTTDFDRTKMSALACLAGLYPPVKEQTWNKEIPWQPIPYHTPPYLKDDMLYYYTCPRFLEARLEQLYSPKFQKILQPYRNLFDLISYRTGRNITTPEEIFYIDNLFQAEANYNLPPPDWAVEVMDQIKNMTVIEYNMEFATEELARIGAGTLLQRMISDSYARIQNTIKPAKRKVFLYSAHENNVAAILACTGVYDFHQPPYGSTFVLELHQMVDTKEYVFRILYNKDIYKEPVYLPIPGCGTFCPFEKFVLLTKNKTTRDWKKDCVSKNSIT